MLPKYFVTQRILFMHNYIYLYSTSKDIQGKEIYVYANII